MSRAISFFGFLFVAGLWLLFAAPPVMAANTISASVYQDSNNDGTVDRIRWTMDENVTACVYEAADWTVNTASQMNFTITGLTCSGSDTILYINVTADANETGATTSPVVSYADAATAGSVTLTSGNMTAKASVTITDFANPKISAVAFDTTNCGLGAAMNTITLTMTEQVQVSANGGSSFASSDAVTSSTTLGAMTTARTLAGIGSWGSTNGGDMAQNSAVVNRVSINAGNLIVCLNYVSSGYFSSGSTAPSTATFTPTSDVTAIKDLVNLPLQTGTVNATGGTWDVTAPTVSTTYSCDQDGDGDIERIQINFSESVYDSALAVGQFEGDNDSSNNGTGEETPSSFSTQTGACDGNADDTDANDEKMRIDFTTGISGTDAAYVNIQALGARDMSGNTVALVSGGGTETDKAGPRLSTSSPAHGGSISRTATFSLTFTEAIATGSFAATLSGFSGTFSAAWSVGNTVATLTPTGTYTKGSRTFTITTAPDASSNAFGGGVVGVTIPMTITVTGGSSSTAEPEVEAYAVTLTSPNGGESFADGDVTTITWTSTGSGMNYASLYYTTDGGTTYETIAEDVTNNGSYDWTVPDIDSANVTLYLVGTDLATNLANDSSDAVFTIGAPATEAMPSDEEEAAQDDVVEAPTTGATGISPVTGEVEDISVVNPGDYIKGLSFSTVYYVDEGLVRRPFYDAQTYFTYEENFDAVVTVTDATLTTLALGVPMQPRVGVALVKITSSDAVYAVGSNGALRWIASEEVATANFGIAWSDYVIDLPVTLFAQLAFGEDVIGLEYGGTSGMKTRFALSIENPDDDTDGDELSDAEELRLGTALGDADTDDDGYPDALEVGTGHDPLAALDSDNDGYPDYLEILHGYDPYASGGARLVE